MVPYSADTYLRVSIYSSEVYFFILICASVTESLARSAISTGMTFLTQFSETLGCEGSVSDDKQLWVTLNAKTQVKMVTC